jgi:hypothetical protein
MKKGKRKQGKNGARKKESKGKRDIGRGMRGWDE